jgi:Fe2+ or Zn2+ uptake regulation protein
MSQPWGTRPVHTAIIELLEKKKSALTDAELLKALKEMYGDLSLSAFHKALMKLEIGGLIHVSSLPKAKKRIELLWKPEEEKGTS